LPGNSGLTLPNLIKDRVTGKQLWSFRFGGGARALCILEADSLVIVATFEPDHSKAHRR